MELIIYAPKEDGFIKSIDWNFDDLKKEITEKAGEYMNLVYSDDQIKEAKKDRAELNKFKKALDDKRKDVKSQVMNPYIAFETQIKELIGIVNKAVDNIDSQVKGYEEGLKQKKEELCRKLYEKYIGDLNRIIPYEKVFNPKWLNKTYPEKAIIEDIQSLYKRVDQDLKVINTDSSKYVFEMKEEYLKEYDMAAAMSLKQHLEETERKKAAFEEQELKRRAEEAKRIREEAELIQTAGNSNPAPVLLIDENGNPVVQKEEKPEKVIMVTFRVTAKESQFQALNEAIKMLKENSQKVEMLKREVL